MATTAVLGGWGPPVVPAPSSRRRRSSGPSPAGRLETPQPFLQCVHAAGAGLGQVHDDRSADATCEVGRVPGTLGVLGGLSAALSLPRTSWPDSALVRYLTTRVTWRLCPRGPAAPAAHPHRPCAFSDRFLHFNTLRLFFQTSFKNKERRGGPKSLSSTDGVTLASSPSLRVGSPVGAQEVGQGHVLPRVTPAPAALA